METFVIDIEYSECDGYRSMSVSSDSITITFHSSDPIKDWTRLRHAVRDIKEKAEYTERAVAIMESSSVTHFVMDMPYRFNYNGDLESDSSL